MPLSKLAYPYEKFSSALEALATSSATLQRRLEVAYLTFNPVKEDDFDDDEMRSAYREIMESLTKIKDPGRGYVPATLAQMNDEEAEAVAEKIYDLFFEISREYHKSLDGA